jgi:hypothetical protein
MYYNYLTIFKLKIKNKYINVNILYDCLIGTEFHQVLLVF